MEEHSMIDSDGVEYLNYSEAAKALGIKQPSLSRKCANGQLMSYNLGIRNQKFVRKDDVERLKSARPIREKYMDTRDAMEKLIRLVYEDTDTFRELTIKYIRRNPDLFKELVGS
jgi:hypothetical protein